MIRKHIDELYKVHTQLANGQLTLRVFAIHIKTQMNSNNEKNTFFSGLNYYCSISFVVHSYIYSFSAHLNRSQNYWNVCPVMFLSYILNLSISC